MRVALSSHSSYPLICTPDNSKADIKTKKEHHASSGLRATLGLTSTVQPESTLGSTSGEERDQSRWKVVMRSLPFYIKNKERQKSIIWDYTHNDNHSRREPQNSITPTPRVVYMLTGGLSQAPPVLEVNLLMQYSLRSSPQAFRTWFMNQSSSATGLPVYTNILHQSSIILDTGKVESESGKCEYADKLESCDEQNYRSLEGKGSRPSPVVVKLRNPFRVLPCEVTLSQVFIGDVKSSRKSKFYLRPLILIED